MKQYKKLYELKNLAKDRLDGKYGSAVLICFLASLISTAVWRIVNLFIPNTGSLFAIYVIDGVTTLIISWMLGVLDLGITLFFLNAACGGDYNVGDLFYGFKGDPSNTLAISGARALISTICLLPAQYLLDAFWFLGNPALITAAGIAAAIGICIHLYAGLAVMLSYFLLLDFPDKSAREILRLSFHLIQGRRKKLFSLQLSFLPLELLSMCSLFIGHLWLTPYMNMTYTCFFLDIMNPTEQTATA